MRFAWDPEKHAQNVLARRLGFEFAALVFDGPTLEHDDERIDYGERRVIAIGVAGDLYLTVVFTDRVEPSGIVRRIISARRSSKNERQAYLHFVAN